MAALAWEAVPSCGACGAAGGVQVGAVHGRPLLGCGACGLVRLGVRVAAASLPRLYAAYYPAPAPAAERLAEQLDNPTFHHRRRRLEAVVPPARRRIFEAGCGDGNFLAHLRGRGWAVAGSEVDAGTVELVRRRHGLRLHAGELGGVPDGPFPVLAAYHVLEHVYQPRHWMAAMHALVEADGVLHLQVPNWGSPTRRLAGAAWASLMFPQHVSFFTPQSLGALLERSGFAVLAVTTWDPWHGPGTVSASVANAARRAMHGLPAWREPDDHADAGSAERAAAPGLARLARRVLDAASVPLARLEAAAGRGAVVDVLARRR